jgi:anhydro-N-acetylmuramic acid kinase
LSGLERLNAIAAKKERRIIGMMSGTSVDAIDAAMVRIKGDAQTGATMTLERFASYPYHPEIRSRVKTLFDRSKADIDEICQLDFIVGEMFALVVKRLIADASLTANDVDLVAAAGQTVWHHPRPTGEIEWLGETFSTRSTLAVGQAAVIAERTGIVTVGDLRVRDIAAGGHGAPLVAYFDWVVGRHAKRGRAMQNIGGIANTTYVKPNAELSEVIAFDNGPGNMVIDELVFLLSGGEESFDRDGERAARGTVREDILAWCMANPYFELKPPKTTGRERFGRQYARLMIDTFPDATADDLIATATALTAESIVDSFRKWIFEIGAVDDLIVSGGGAKNPVLMQMLRDRLPQTEVRAYEHLDAKEAMAMALIANDSILGLPTNVSSATGARPAILGKICL